MTATDDELMVAVQEGDLERLGALFDRYHRALYAFFVRMTADRHASEDLVQEVFVRVLRFRRTYRPGSQFRTWMYEIARNVAHDRRRGGGREMPLDERVDLPARGDGPVEAIAADQENRLLRAALDSLPADKREVLVLSRFQGLRYDEVATLLGCEVGTVKVRVHRAMKALRTRFVALRDERQPWPATK